MSELTVRRVVVACDAVCEFGAAIERATQLAAHWHASLHGVFLEDPGLREAAALPFVRQLTLPTGTHQSFEVADVEELCRGLAGRARQALADAAGRLGLDFTFAVAEAETAETGLAEGDQDLLILQATARPFAGELRLPSRWSRVPYRAARPVLLLRGDRSAGRAVVLLYDPASRAAQASLAAAAEMALLNQRRLVVLAKPEADAAALRGAIAELSPALAAQARIETLSDLGAVSEARLAELGTALLVIDATAGDGEAGALERLVDRARADVLLMR